MAVAPPSTTSLWPLMYDVSGEEGRRRRPRPPARSPRAHRYPVELGQGLSRLGDRRRDRAAADMVHADLVSAYALRCDRPCMARQPRLRGAVRGLLGLPTIAVVESTLIGRPARTRDVGSGSFGDQLGSSGRSTRPASGIDLWCAQRWLDVTVAEPTRPRARGGAAGGP